MPSVPTRARLGKPAICYLHFLVCFSNLPRPSVLPTQAIHHDAIFPGEEFRLAHRTSSCCKQTSLTVPAVTCATLLYRMCRLRRDEYGAYWYAFIQSVALYTWYWGYWCARYLSQYSDWLRAGRSRDRIPMVARFFAYVQTDPGAHQGLLYNRYRVFPGSKAVGVWCWPPTPSSAEVENE
jgi:hypothetical protein